MDEYMSVKEIASLLKVNIVTVRRWVRNDKLPAYKLGKDYRITKKDLDKFLSERRVNA